MHFRERVRKALGRSAEGESASRRNSNTYAPGEPMPKPKFRAPDPEHKEKLEAFSWTTAWRRKSDQSMVSPMSSRRGSTMTAGRRSMQVPRASVGQVDEVVEAEEEGEKVGRSPAYNRGKSPPGYGRTDQGASPGSKSPLSKTDGNSGPAIGGTHAYQPFTEDELTLAMKRSNLQVPAQS